MRVCDRHNDTRAAQRIILSLGDEQYDLCAQCASEVKKFLSDVEAVVMRPPKRGRPPKNSA